MPKNKKQKKLSELPPGNYQVTDGSHRMEVARELGIDPPVEVTEEKPNNIKITKAGYNYIRARYGDGHSIVAPDSVPFSELGLSDDDKFRLTQTFESDMSHPKAMIFRKGKVVPKLTGVYLLKLWYAVARANGVDASNNMSGRGFQARAVCDALLRTEVK